MVHVLHNKAIQKMRIYLRHYSLFDFFDDLSHLKDYKKKTAIQCIHYIHIIFHICGSMFGCLFVSMYVCLYVCMFV